MTPFFSVLIPVYNQVGKMDKCIDSLNAQSFKEFEVIFVDDGSTDDSYEMLKKYAKEDERFSVLRHEKNSSLVYARHTAMQKATGEYIFILDSDDYLENDAFAILHDFIMENRVDIVRFGCVAEPMKYEIMPKETEDLLGSFLEGKDESAIWKRCYSKDLITKVLESFEPFYCNMGEDTFYTVLLYTYANSHKDLNQILYHYETEGMSSVSMPVSLEKMIKDYASINAVEENVTAFMEKNNKEYLEAAQKQIRFMKRFTLGRCLLNDADYKDVIEKINIIDREKDAGIYDFCCNKVIPYKEKRAIYQSEKELEGKRIPMFMEICREE